ncbi:MAG: glutamine-hydrolyzing carbamoyl-phosphate synthase small subunit [Ilumatobacteraceae bacterium]|jgi:carbamoyl-phosphate synthase small subunit|nr:glutamine-hydrolyzing carbamoyl-phosphate synthase small subunit [Ilumatobacteraceae bacterium]
MSAPNGFTDGHLVLANGEVFEGEVFGALPASGISSGEVVFNTAITGYQEIITDPSYAGQIITFTQPHIGNYGTVDLDNESVRPFARGVVMRQMARRHSNWRAQDSLLSSLQRWGIPAIGGIDTRRLTRILRDAGAMSGSFGTADTKVLLQAAQKEKGTAGVDLVSQVTTQSPYEVGNGKYKVVAYDFGIKSTIVNCLAEIATVRVVPAHTSADEVLQMKPDGVFLSNGPGDPEMVGAAVQSIKDLLEKGVPIFGICLGHQLLARALGAQTYKLPFGHHGGNHPVKRLETGTVEITSQNHNFCVDEKSLAQLIDVTHINLNDETNEGMKVRGARAFSVQYHPEAGPGPHDSRYLFNQFANVMDGK